MKIHEYQAKELLAAAGANVPKHVVVRTPEEAAAAFDQLSGGGGVMLKAQVHAGGRGKGRFKGYDYEGVTKVEDQWGGVTFVNSRDKMLKRAAVMLKYPLATKQTGAEGQPVKTLIVQADANPAKEQSR